MATTPNPKGHPTMTTKPEPWPAVNVTCQQCQDDAPALYWSHATTRGAENEQVCATCWHLEDTPVLALLEEANVNRATIPAQLLQHMAEQFRNGWHQVGYAYAVAVTVASVHHVANAQQTARATWGDRATWSRGRGWHEAGTEVAR
jgi:hypothetical protein